MSTGHEGPCLCPSKVQAAVPSHLGVKGLHQPNDSCRERREQESSPWVSPGCLHPSTDLRAMQQPLQPGLHSRGRSSSPCPVPGSRKGLRAPRLRVGFQLGPASCPGSSQLNQFLGWLQQCRGQRLCSCAASWATPRVSLSPPMPSPSPGQHLLSCVTCGLISRGSASPALLLSISLLGTYHSRSQVLGDCPGLTRHKQGSAMLGCKPEAPLKWPPGPGPTDASPLCP